jgi:hypothetical protein
MNYEDAVPQKLNAEAWKEAKRLNSVVGAAETIAKIAAEHIELRAERQRDMMEAAIKLRDMMQDADKKMKQLREDGLAEIQRIEKEHDAIMLKIREVQPELQNHEFSLNIENGTYTLIGARDPEEIIVEAEEETTAEDPETVRIKATVDALLAKYMRPTT